MTIGRRLFSILILFFTLQASGSAQAPKARPAADPAADRAGSVIVEPARMPDVIGLHLGMDAKEALAIMRSHYPKNRITEYNNNMSTFPAPVFQGAYINPATAADDTFNFQMTLPPDKQVVWKVKRLTKNMHVNRETLLATLRAKYGKESGARGCASQFVSRDAQICSMWWLFDEAGRHVAGPQSDAAMATWCNTATPDGPGGAFLLTEAQGQKFPNQGACNNYVSVKVDFDSDGQILERVNLEMTHVPLALRTAHSTAVWYRAQAERARQQDLEKSKKAKPVF